MKRVSIVQLMAVALAFLFLTTCTTKKVGYVYNEGAVFGTFYHFTYDSLAGDQHQAILEVLEAFNHSLSTYDSTSVISRFNRGEKGVKADAWFKQVFETAKGISAQSDGAFDMTVAPLVNAWGFGFNKMDQVTPQVIDSLKQLVGMNYIAIDSQDNIVSEKPGVMLDASAIAKGFGVDVVADFLRSKGVRNFLVEIGGELATAGVNPRGNPWRVGIDKPIDDPQVVNRELQFVVQLSGKAMATSGNYRNFYVKDGKKFAHTIDPRTGYPVEHSLLSATIVANDCMTADAYATACMVLGLTRSKVLIESLQGVEACFIYQDTDAMKVYLTAGFEKYCAE